MSITQPPSFDLRLLPSFVVVAQELHFGRAAGRLFIAQPALSRQIARLEQQLGVTLFHRTSRGVELTADGATLLSAALDILQHATRAETAARAGDAGLRLHLSEATVPPEVIAAVRAISSTEPGLRLTVLEGSHADSIRAVVDGSADVGFEFLEGVPAGLAYAPLSRERWGVLSADTHRLARSSSASWSDLDGLTVLLAPPGLLDGYNRALTFALRHFDVSCELIDGPPIKPTYLQNYLLGQSDRVLVCAEYVSAPLLPGMCWVPLVPEAPHEWGVIWNDDRATPTTRRFVERMRQQNTVAAPVDEMQG